MAVQPRKKRNAAGASCARQFVIQSAIAVEQNGFVKGHVSQNMSLK
jgi:hypothetical protein